MKLIQEVEDILHRPGSFEPEKHFYKRERRARALLELFARQLEDAGFPEAAKWVRDESFVLP